MEERAVFPLFLCHKFSSILREAQTDGNIPPQMLSRFKSFQQLMIHICNEIRDKELLYHLIDVVSECRIFYQKGSPASVKRLTHFFFTRKMMRQLDNIETKLKSDTNAAASSTQSKESQSATTFITNKESEVAIIGLERERDIIKMWLTDNSKYSAFMAIGIVGIRCGCGKTSLAHKVFSSPVVESEFSPRIWVCLSDMYGKEDVMDPRTRVVIHILKELGQDVSKLCNADYSIVKLLKDLHDRLMGKRYFIVLDDVWEMDEWLGDLGYILPRGYPMGEFLSHGLPKERGGAVIVTSRWESVAKRMIGNDRYMIRLENKLSDDVCWKIFCHHLRRPEDEVPIILKQDLLSICDGLPLAAMILADKINDAYILRSQQ